jgi:xanthine dehydrogenase iron-sulfur cluster and FAD-binding subunit A
MECLTAKTLFEDYARAAAEYFEAVDKLSQLVGSHEKFEVAKHRTDEKSAQCRAIRLALENHRVEHNCRAMPSTV